MRKSVRIVCGARPRRTPSKATARPGAGKPFRVDRDGKQELRVEIEPGDDLRGAQIVEELSW